jgi:hypothetical protein
MEFKKMKSIFFAILGFFHATMIIFLMGCSESESKKNIIAPHSEIDTSGDAIISAEEQSLSKTSTGQAILNFKKSLLAQGYSIKTITTSPQQILELNGHPGAAYSITNKSIVIYISSEFDLNTKAHAIAHELFHIKDDLEVQSFLKDYPEINSAAEKFVHDWKSAGKKITKNSVVDKKIMNYVLGTLFCSEARAYNFNKTILVEGLKTNAFSNVKSLSQFLDQTYIAPFGTTYGNQAKPMLQKCLAFADMTAVQSELINLEE